MNIKTLSNSRINASNAAANTIDFLIVAGAGGGGYDVGGGGGAGGYLTGTFSATSGGTYTITVGAGGAAGGLRARQGRRTVLHDRRHRHVGDRRQADRPDEGR